MTETEESKQPEFTYIRDANFRSVYANNTVFSSTAFDFSMRFAEIMEVNTAGKHVQAEERVKVVMSPLHFKLFAQVCMQNVKLYEDRFGIIGLSDGSSAGVVADSRAAHASPEAIITEPSR